MLDRVGLIHMNARLYDPVLARFIQADTMVEDDATQGLNRYTYCLNNPLSRTDPSGNLSFRQVLGLAIGIAFAVVSQQYWAANALWASFATAVGSRLRIRVRRHRIAQSRPVGRIIRSRVLGNWNGIQQDRNRKLRWNLHSSSRVIRRKRCKGGRPCSRRRHAECVAGW